MNEKKIILILPSIFMCAYFVSAAVSISFMLLFQVLFIISILILVIYFKIEIFRNIKVSIRYWLFLTLCVFFIWWLISTLNSQNSSLSIQRIPIYLSSFLLFFCIYIYISILSMIYFKSETNQNSFNKNNKSLKIIVTQIFPFALSMVIILHFVYLSYLFFNRIPKFTRTAGLLGSQTALSSVYPLLIYTLLFFVTNEKNFKKKIFYLLALLSGIASLIISGSRTPIYVVLLFFVIYTIYIVLKQKKAFSKIILLIVICLSIVGLFMVKESNIFNRIFDAPKVLLTHMKMLFINEKIDGSDIVRVGFWKASVAVIKTLPLTGTGPFAWFDYLFNKTNIGEQYIIKSGWWQHAHCHNDILQIASEMGLPAILFYIVFILSTLILVFKNYKKLVKIPFYFESTIIFISYLFIGLTEYTVFHPNSGPLIWTNYALIILIAEGKFKFLSNGN